MRFLLLVAAVVSMTSTPGLQSPPMREALRRGLAVALAEADKTRPTTVADARAQDVRVVEITAERFAFTPSEIKVKAGTRLEIRLRSDDTAHGFRILGTDVDLVLPKRGRGVATVTFEPQAGRYTFECSQLCGAGHEFMRGVIIAE